MALKYTWEDKVDNVDEVQAKDINDIAEAVINLEEENEIEKAPHIGENGNWFEWNKEQEFFVDTGIKAQGEKGEKGEKGESYILTEEDKNNIAQIALDEVLIAEGVRF